MPRIDDDFRMEVQSMYDTYLQKTEKRGPSWGEVTHIENLPKRELKGLYNELVDELYKKKK